MSAFYLALGACLTGTLALFIVVIPTLLFYWLSARHKRRCAAAAKLRVPAPSARQRRPVPEPQGDDVVDVIIVGAGPSGSTAAYYLAHEHGFTDHRVVLLEKKSFPRVKLCGDAWCPPALDILEDMHVLQRIEKDGKCLNVRRGGFVSPSGFTCVGGPYGSAENGGKPGPRTYAIKRVVADEYIARRAAEVGADLRENAEVVSARFDEAAGLWNVEVKQHDKEEGDVTAAASNSAATTTTLRSRVLVAADGSTSYLARSLGLATTGQGDLAECSHRYIKAGTHAASADGVMMFNRSMLPGYTALFKHYDGELFLGTYVLPGGKATSRSIVPFEKELTELHPTVLKELGPSYEWAKRAQMAPIRVGGVPRPYGDNGLLIVGDAAAQVDPLTGEGIHTGMIAAREAARTIREMFATGNFSTTAGEIYAERCMAAFGDDFAASALAAALLHRLPILLDVAAVVGQRRGQSFLDEFGEIMCGVRPKSDFLSPHIAVEMSLELARQVFLQKICRIRPQQPTDIGAKIVAKHASASARSKAQKAAEKKKAKKAC